MRGTYVRHPIANGFVDCILQGAAAGVHGCDLRAQQFHARDVGRLPRHVVRAHVNDALETEERAHGRRGHAMLSRPGLRDDALFAHPLGQQGLAERVVDLVGSGVVEVLALQIDAGPAGFLREPCGEVEARRPADVVVQDAAELGYVDNRGKWVNIAKSGATFTPPDTLAEDTSVRFATLPPDVPFERY